MLKKVFLSMLAACMLVMGGIPIGVSSAAASPGLEIQCVSDQLMGVPGGKVGYHILYHNVQNQTMSKAWLKIKVPKEFDVDVAAGADWDGASGTLKWNLKDLDANGADVVHFNLKVKDNVQDQSQLEVVCSGGVGDIQLTGDLVIRVTIGTETDQPVFVGYPDSKFHPERQLTRAETAAIVARVKNLPNSPSPKAYNDVPADHWAIGYINRVSASGYMSGYGDGSFHPDQPISRAEFLVVMLRVRGIEPIPVISFPDSNEHWAMNVIGTSKALNYLDGQVMDSFNPDGYINRDAAAKFLGIMLYRGELKDGDIPVVQHWPDVSKDLWSFGWIEELSLIAHESKHDGPLSERLIRYLPDQTKPL